MSMENIDMYYFSGTGNTRLVVERMMEVFRDSGVKTTLQKIEDSKTGDVDLNHTLGIGFPVAILSTYSFVWDFINGLPEAHGTEIFMVDTLGGCSGGIVGPLRKILEKKGYKTIGACEIVMPLNIFYIQDSETCKTKVQRGLMKAEEYAHALVEGRARWGRVPVFSDVMKTVSMGGLKLAAWGPHQRYLKFRVERSLCNLCGTCADLCPVGNIKMEEHPVAGDNCQYCMRCVSFCPLGAIPCIMNYRGKTYSAMNHGEMLK
ncbi:hypothetical protein DSECCO2_126360 [anaerobic digester metagenome]